MLVHTRMLLKRQYSNVLTMSIDLKQRGKLLLTRSKSYRRLNRIECSWFPYPFSVYITVLYYRLARDGSILCLRFRVPSTGRAAIGGKQVILLLSVAVLGQVCYGRLSSDSLLLKTQKACFPALFSFGSSLADTGTSLILQMDSPRRVPFGMTYPGVPSGRWSDGRLVVDLLADKLGIPYLDPFLRGGSDFRHGVNFASAGAPVCAQHNFSEDMVLNLDFQVYHFKSLKRQVLKESQSIQRQVHGCGTSLPSSSIFGDALYVIAMGANDYHAIARSNASSEEQRTAVLDVSDGIMRAVEALYYEGARNILVENLYPVHCMALSAADLAALKEAGQLDSNGCNKFGMELVSRHNSALREQIQSFSEKHSPELSIAMIDMFTIRRDLIFNPEKHGFKEGTRLCWEGDDSKPCSDPSEFVVWNGVHYTEAANAATLKAVLSGKHFHPSFPLDRLDSCLASSLFSRQWG